MVSGLTPQPSSPGTWARNWAPPLGLAALFTVLTAWSWRKWTDPLVDFGRELYQPWQILEGRMLYRDLASLFGPLGSHVNALWFRLFDVSLTTLVVSNLALTATLAILAYRFFLAAADRLTATLVTAIFLVVFAFPHHFSDVANYNFVCPYTHAATYGTLLLAAGVSALSLALTRGGLLAWAGAGLLLASSQLTKPEVGLSAAFVLALALTWHFTSEEVRLKGPAFLLMGAAVPLVGVGVALEPNVLLAPWLPLFQPGVTDNAFYARVMGTDDSRGNLLRLFGESVLWGGSAAVALAADLRWRRRPERKTLAWVSAAVVVGLMLLWDPNAVGRPLPVFVVVAGTWLAVIAWKRRRRGEETAHLVPLVLWSATAAVLLGKMFLNARLLHFGFYLMMPATLLAVAVGVGVLPRLLAERHEGAGWLVRPTSIAAVGLLIVSSFVRSNDSYSARDLPVGRGGDLIRALPPDRNPSGALVARALEIIVERVPENATLAVLPEGVMINYLARRANPTPFDSLMPPEMAFFGEERVLAAYREHAPDFIILVDRGEEYGVGPFGGASWGGKLVAWMRTDYELLVDEGEARSRLRLWRRIDQ